MKKRWMLPLLVLLIITLPVTAFAQVATNTSMEEDAPPTNLFIDNQSVYEGMTTSYQQGYAPVVQNAVATIVLPVLASGPVAGSAIIATPDLGDPSSSPFVYNNYQKTVPLLSCPVNGGTGIMPAFLVRFDLPLTAQRINGIYPVAISLRAQNLDGSAIEQTYTTYVTITDGKNPSSGMGGGGGAGVQKPTSQPKIIVSSYTLTPSPIVAGQEFSAKVTLQNTNETKGVQNMTVTVSTDCPSLSLLNSSNTFYIDKLGKGETFDLELKYKSGADTPPKQYALTFAIEYDNSEATTLTAAGTVPVTITQPLQVEMEPPQVAADVNAGDTLPLSIQVMNLGRSMAYNVRCAVDAPGLLPTGLAFIGNMEAGTAKTGQLDVFVGTKDMSGADGKYGLTKGTVTLTYEDEAGNEFTQKAELSTTIHEPVMSAAAQPPKEEPQKAGQWWISLSVGVLILAGLLVLFRIRRKNKVKLHEVL